jgi:hypothetical protein
MKSNYNEYEFWNNRKVPNAQPKLSPKCEQFLKDQLEGCGKIVDFWVGTGRLFPVYRELGIDKVVVYDIVDAYIDTAEGVARLNNLEMLKIENKEAPEDIVPKFKARARYYDAVVCSSVLLHLRPQYLYEVMDAIQKIAKKVIVLTYFDKTKDFVDTGEAHEGPEHCFNYDYLSVCEEAGWRVDEWEDVGAERQLCFVYTGYKTRG